MATKPYLLSVLLIVGVNSLSQNKLRDGYTVDFRSAFDQDLYEDVLDTELCNQQLVFLRNNSLGLHFLDASATIPNGFSTGNVNDLGDYFQCLSINQFVDNMDIQGKYCTINVPLDQNPIQIPEVPELPELPEWPEWPEIPEIPWPTPNNETLKAAEEFVRLQEYALGISGLGEPVSMRIFPMATTAQFGMTLAVCVPKVCSATQAVDFFLDSTPFLNFTYREFYCRLPNDKVFSTADYVAIGVFSVIGCLLIICTAYDLCHLFVLKRDSSKANSLYRCFSVYTNTRRFLTFNTVPGALECVDGIRAISMMWVIVGHTYSLTLLGFIHNLIETLGWLRKFSSTWVNSAPITVDTFFLLSGVLAVYSTVGKISRRRFIQTVHLFYLNRLMRMFPLLATVVLLQASVFNHVSDGPYWQNVAHAAENCRTYWWAALLHIQNYVNSLEVCLAHTWYLSVDIQLYLVCPIVMVWMFGRERFAWIALTLIVLLSLAFSTTYSFVNNFSAALANPSRVGQFNDYVTTYYINTLCRASPFFIGMIYGYILHLCRNKKVYISKINLSILWILSFAMMAFCIFSMYPVMQADHTAQLFDNILNSYMRAIWAVALGWLIFACVQGYGGPINWFLSLQMWKLPARLSYAMYLIHLPIIMIANSSWVKTHYFTNGNNLYRFMGDISLSVVAAFILCITIDAPFSTLQKLLLGGGKKRPQKPKSESRQNIVEEGPYIKTSL